MTGGAALAASSGFSVRGRCSTQTLSCASTATLEASPSFHCGGTFGQDRSTANIGTERACCDCARASAATRHAAAVATAATSGTVWQKHIRRHGILPMSGRFDLVRLFHCSVARIARPLHYYGGIGTLCTFMPSATDV